MTKDLVGQVVTLLLPAGQEIIGTLVSKNDKELVLSKPRMPVQNEKGLALMPIMTTGDTDDVVSIERDKVLCHGLTNAQFVGFYQQATSPLIQPQKGLIQ